MLPQPSKIALSFSASIIYILARGSFAAVNPPDQHLYPLYFQEPLQIKSMTICSSGQEFVLLHSHRNLGRFPGLAPEKPGCAVWSDPFSSDLSQLALLPTYGATR